MFVFLTAKYCYDYSLSNKITMYLEIYLLPQHLATNNTGYFLDGLVKNFTVQLSSNK